MAGTQSPSLQTIARVFFTLVALAALTYLLYRVRSTIGLVLIAIFLAVALGPAVDLFDRRLRMPRGLAILGVYVLIALGIFGVGLLIVPPIVDQVDGLSGDIPGYLQDLRDNDTFREYDDKYDITVKLREQADNLPQRLGDAAGALQSVTVGAFSAIFQLITVLTITFFLLLDGSRIMDVVFRRTRHREPRVRAVAGEIYRAVSGYVAGSLAIAAIAGVTTYVVLTLLGVPFAVPLAVLMAFLDLIPLIGATIGGALILLVTAFTDFPTATIVWGAFFILYQQVENNVLQPAVYRRTVDVPPLLVIVSILMGASLLGVLGALVAIPVAATIQILVRDVIRVRDEVEAHAPGLAVELGEPPVDPPAPGAPPVPA